MIVGGYEPYVEFERCGFVVGEDWGVLDLLSLDGICRSCRCIVFPPTPDPAHLLIDN